MNSSLLIIVGSFVAILLLIGLIHVGFSLSEARPAYCIYKFLSYVGIDLKVPWYYGLPLHSKYKGLYLISIRSKPYSLGFKLIYKFRSAYPHTSTLIEGSDLDRAYVEYIRVHKKEKDSLITDANIGIRALKILNDKHKYKYRIVGGKVI